ncbi:MAG: glycosyltransferase family 4 protein [Acidobacteria bacterium]|nr:glycosyltransferase family 4 protein [Acidobacteriota bacterium]
MIRVAIVEHVGGHGGMEFYDFGLCEALHENGVMPFLYTCDETVLDEKAIFRTKVLKVYRGIYKGRSKIIRGFRFLKGALDAAKGARQNGCQVAHFHIFHFSWFEYVEMWIFKRRGFRIVATVHDVESFNAVTPCEHGNYGKFEKIIDEVIVHTQYACKILLEHFSNYPSKSVHHILPMDFDTVFKTALSQLEARQFLNLPTSGQMILFFGQVKEVKGLDVLLEAFQSLVETRKDVFLVIAGKTWQVNFGKYEHFIVKNGLSDHVVLRVNYIENGAVPLYFKSADMIVLPYKKIFNSSVLQRALDYGTPAIVSDLEPLTEIIQDRVNGFVFSTGDKKELSEKLCQLADDEDLRMRLVARGRETVEKMYNHAMIGEQTKQVFIKALLRKDKGRAIH